jgi:hypothetical protein
MVDDRVSHNNLVLSVFRSCFRPLAIRVFEIRAVFLLAFEVVTGLSIKNQEFP